MTKKRLAEFFSARGGNIAVMGALLSPVLVVALAISVDYANLVKIRRTAQAHVDLAAIAGAYNLDKAVELVSVYFADNGIDTAIEVGSNFRLPTGEVVSAADVQLNQIGCTATVNVGKYVADSRVAANMRFASGPAAEANAVRVTQTCKAPLYFGASLMKPPNITVSGTSTTQNLASFWIGSRLARLDGGILNSLLSQLSGSTISLDVMDYNALFDADVDLLSTTKMLATQLNLQAATYNDVLNANVGLERLFAAIRVGGNVSASAQVGLKSLERALARNTRPINLRRILNFDDVASLPIGSRFGGPATVKAFDLIRAAVVASNGANQARADFGLNVPGVGQVVLKVAIGEPPEHARSVAVGSPLALVRTAQTRLALTVKTGGLLALVGTEVTLPIYLELANGEARLTSILCRNTVATSVNLDVVPGVASLTIGNVDPTAFINFGSAPRVTPATLVEAPLGLKIVGSSQVDINNVYKSGLTFSQYDIDSKRVKSVSVTTPVTSLLGSLLDHLHLDVSLSGYTLQTAAPVYTGALKTTLSALATPVDGLISSVTSALGVKIGQVDVGVTGASCLPPVLVL